MAFFTHPNVSCLVSISKPKKHLCCLTFDSAKIPIGSKVGVVVRVSFSQNSCLGSNPVIRKPPLWLLKNCNLEMVVCDGKKTREPAYVVRLNSACTYTYEVRLNSTHSEFTSSGTRIGAHWLIISVRRGRKPTLLSLVWL